MNIIVEPHPHRSPFILLLLRWAATVRVPLHSAPMTIYENGMSDLSPTDQQEKVRSRRSDREEIEIP